MEEERHRRGKEKRKQKTKGNNCGRTVSETGAGERYVTAKRQEVIRKLRE